MKRVLISLLLLVPWPALAADVDHRRAIDEQVWRPFLRALLDLDVAAYFDVHSRDVVRVDRARARVSDRTTYEAEVSEGFRRAAEAKAAGTRADIELRFTERLSGTQAAYEVGYYRMRLTLPNGTEVLQTSNFHVTLRQEGGRWKILTDSSVPVPDLDEAAFQAAQRLGQ